MMPRKSAMRLRMLLRTQTNVKNGIVFANRKTTVALLEKSLRKHGFSAGALHGDMDQSARLKMLAAFRNNEVTYLIASDVAARGLDIPEVSHVFNFDVPIHAEDYVHRVGRTGRAGREGHAFTMVTREEAKHLRAIETLIKKEIAYFDIGDGGRQRRSAGKGTPGAAWRQKAKPSPGEARGSSANLPLQNLSPQDQSLKSPCRKPVPQASHSASQSSAGHGPSGNLKTRRNPAASTRATCRRSCAEVRNQKLT